MPSSSDGHRGDRLEGRAGRIGGGDRAVEQRRAVLLGVELVEGLLRQRLGEDVGVEGRVGAEREHLAVARVHRHVGARLRRVAVGVGGLDRALERVVGGALEVEVERQAQPLALLGLAARDLAAVVAVAERVDDDAREAVLAAQVAVVGLLDPVLADARAGRDPAVLLLLELLGRDLAQRPEQLGRQVLVGIGAQEQLLDVDAGELVLALLEVVEGGARHVGLDRHVGVRRLRDPLDHAPVDRARRHPEHVAEAAEAAAQVRLAGGHRRHRDGTRAARRAHQHAALAALGARVAALLLAAGALERAQLVGGGEARALGARARGAVAVGDLQLGLGQAARDDLDDRRDARAHEPVAVAVDDVAARRLDLDLAHAVLARLGHVVLAREHLQEPQAEEDDREQHEREAPEHGDPHRELRRDRGAALFHVGRAHAREIGLSPPVV